MSRRTILNESYFVTGIWPFRFHRNFIYFFTNTDITFFWAMTCTEEKEKHKRRNKTSFLNIQVLHSLPLYIWQLTGILLPSKLNMKLLKN